MIKKIVLTAIALVSLTVSAQAGISEDVIKESIIKHSMEMGVDPALALSIAKKESGFKHETKSPYGAVGVFQLLPSTAKKLGYNPYYLNENIKAIILTGENRGEIMRELLSYFESSGKNIKLSSAEKFGDAVLLAIKAASKGDTVLLSPASTSFDAFSDYKERGNAFSSIIKNYYADK